MTNPAREALTRAVNKAIANGAPVYENQPATTPPEMWWAIRNSMDTGLAWSNKFGWVDNDTYDIFTREEVNTLALPIGGEWWKI